MTDLTEYAKREAEHEYPDVEDPTAYAIRTMKRDGAEWGILRLAEQLQREDVIQAGGKALFVDHATDRIGETAPEIAETCERLVRTALAAMFAKIAEGADDVE